MLYTLALLIADHKNIRLKFHRYVLCLLLNPIFILLYIPIYVDAIFKKNVTWVAIERTKLTPQSQILQTTEGTDVNQSNNQNSQDDAQGQLLQEPEKSQDELLEKTKP